MTDWYSRLDTVVVLGAGASHDYGTAFLSFDSQWRPPLTVDLFSPARHGSQEMEAILQVFSGAAACATGLAAAVSSGAAGMEQELERLKSHPDDEVRGHFFDIPQYLSMLFRSVSKNFGGQSPGWHTELVDKVALQRQSRVLFVSLNYDYLLERDITRMKKSHQFTDIGHYLDPLRQVLVYKPHGSCNWSTPLPDTYRNLKRPPPVGDLQISVDGDDEKWSDRYPILTAPVVNKTADEQSIPGAAWDSVSAELAHRATHLLAIGTSGLDEHVWKGLRRLFGLSFSLLVVGSGSKHTDLAAERIQAALGMQDGQPITYARGYSEFMQSNELDTFLESTHGLIKNS